MAEKACSSLRDARFLRPSPRGLKPTAYSYPRVIHRSEESPQELLPAASVNNSAAQKVLGMNLSKISHNQENTHRPVTNSTARHSTPNGSPSSRAMRWSLTNTQWRTASISRSHYKPFARISQRVFLVMGNLAEVHAKNFLRRRVIHRSCGEQLLRALLASMNNSGIAISRGLKPTGRGPQKPGVAERRAGFLGHYPVG